MGTRIKDLFSTTAAPAADDYAVLDGAGSGTRKILATALGATGGATPAASATLTALSPAVQVMTPPGFGCAFTLPDATTCPKRAPLFQLSNDSADFDVLIKNAAGTLKGFIRPKSTVLVALADNSTAAGVWSLFGAKELGVSAGAEFYGYTFANGFPLNYTGVYDIDADRQLILVDGSTKLYAVVYNQTTATWGALTQIRTNASSISGATGLYLGADKFLMVSNVGTAGEAVVLSFSGTTITVNSPTTFTEVSGASYNGASGQFFAVGSTYTVVQYISGIPYFRGFTVSGTTVTAGANNDPTGGAGGTNPQGYSEGGSLILFYWNSGTTYARIFTVSGTTFTSGTGTSITAAGSRYRAVRLTTGRFMVFTGDASAGLRASLVSASGSTLNINTVTVDAAATSGTYFYNSDLFEAIAISTTKVVFAYGSNGFLFFNLVRDNAGVAAVGTAFAPIPQSTMDIMMACQTDGASEARFAFGISNSSLWHYARFDCSGTSPALTSWQQMYRPPGLTPALATYSPGTGRTDRNLLYPNIITGTTATYAFNSSYFNGHIGGLYYIRYDKTATMQPNDLTMLNQFLGWGGTHQSQVRTSTNYAWMQAGHGTFALFRKLEVAQ